MAKYASLNDAMVAKDDLAEAEMRYKLLSESFEELPQLRANLNPALEKVKLEIGLLRAAAAAKAPRSSTAAGDVIPIDPNRFRKSTDKGA